MPTCLPEQSRLHAIQSSIPLQRQWHELPALTFKALEMHSALCLSSCDSSLFRLHEEKSAGQSIQQNGADGSGLMQVYSKIL